MFVGAAMRRPSGTICRVVVWRAPIGRPYGIICCNNETELSFMHLPCEAREPEGGRGGEGDNLTVYLRLCKTPGFNPCCKQVTKNVT